MKKTIVSLLTWGVITTYAAGVSAVVTTLQFRSFTSQIVNPVPLEGKENELANRLDQVVAGFAERAELEAMKAGFVSGAASAAVVALGLAGIESFKNKKRLTEYRKQMEAKTLEMTLAFRAGNMERFTAIATEIAEQRGSLS